MTYAQLREENFLRQFVVVPNQHVMHALVEMKLELYAAHADESSIDDDAEDGEYFYTTVNHEYIAGMSFAEIFALGPFGVETPEEAGQITATATIRAIALAQGEIMTDTISKVPADAYNEAFALIDKAVELIDQEMNVHRNKLLKRRGSAARKAEVKYGTDSIEFKKAVNSVDSAGHGEYAVPQWLCDASLAVGAVAYELGKAAHKSVLDYQDVLGAIMQLERHALPDARLSRIHEIAQELDAWHTRHIFEREETVTDDFVSEYVREVVAVDPSTGQEHNLYVALVDFDDTNAVHRWVDEEYAYEGIYAWQVNPQIQPGARLGDDQRLFVRFA